MIFSPKWKLTDTHIVLKDHVQISRFRMSKDNYFSFMIHLMEKDWWDHMHTIKFTDLYSQHLRERGINLYETGVEQ